MVLNLRSIDWIIYQRRISTSIPSPEHYFTSNFYFVKIILLYTEYLSEYAELPLDITTRESRSFVDLWSPLKITVPNLP